MSRKAGLEFSAALEASHIMQGGVACSLSGTCLIRLDATAPSATYYIQAIDLVSGALPANGAVTHRAAPMKVIHVNGTDDLLLFDWGNSPIPCPNGVAYVLSTTEFTKTISGAYLSIGGQATQ